jgi:hypothetical protein
MMSAIGWGDLFATGSIFDLDIGRWNRMGTLRPEDLGIQNLPEVRKSFTWGSIKLIPDLYIKPLWSTLNKAHSALDRYTVPFKLIPGARFVVSGSKKELEAALARLAEELDEQIEEFISDYEKAKLEQHTVLKTGFVEAAKSGTAVERAMARLPLLYPTTDQLREKFYIRWRSYSLATPQDGTFDGDTLREARDVRDAIKGMLEQLRKELVGRSEEIADLVVRGGRITQKTYNATDRLCSKIDRVCRTFNDPALIAASKALRIAIDDARAYDDNTGERDQVLVNGVKAVKRELRDSLERSIKDVVDGFTPGRRRLR